MKLKINHKKYPIFLPDDIIAAAFADFFNSAQNNSAEAVGNAFAELICVLFGSESAKEILSACGEMNGICAEKIFPFMKKLLLSTLNRLEREKMRLYR